MEKQVRLIQGNEAIADLTIPKGLIRYRWETIL